MAEAERVTIVYRIAEDHVNLHMTVKEATVLKDILRNVGGDPNRSNRKYAESVLNGLKHINLPDIKYPCNVGWGPAGVVQLQYELWPSYE